MNKSILELVAEEYIVLDGGMGTLLQDKGLTSSELPEEWNIQHPEVVKGIHLDYLIAGAQIIETNTLGGSSLKLQAKGKEHLIMELNRCGVELAIEALKTFRNTKSKQNDGRYIAGSVGPTGKIFEMDLSPEKAEKAFSEQATILADAGVDIFLVETMLDLREAEIAVKTLKRETDLPVFASLVFNRTKKGEFRTIFGNSIADTVYRLIDAGTDAVGANCGLIDEYVEVIKQMRSLTPAPLILYPNAGLPVLKNGKTTFNQSSEYLISFLDESIEAGATIVGGCCGTTPEYIHLISEKINGRKLNL